MRLRLHITRQLYSLWQALMVVPSASSAEFMDDIVPAVRAMRDRSERRIAFIEQGIANRKARRAEQ